MLPLDFIELLCRSRPVALADMFPRFGVNQFDWPLDLFGMHVVAFAALVKPGTGRERESTCQFD